MRRGLTGGAQPFGLDHGLFDPETRGICTAAKGTARHRRGLGHRAAFAADHEGRIVIRAGTGTGDKGVQPLDPVGKPLRNEKRQRAVGHRRLGAHPLAVKPRQHVIGTHGRMGLEQDFQHAAAHRGELHLARHAGGIGGGKRRTHTDAMIVARKPGLAGHGRRHIRMTNMRRLRGRVWQHGGSALSCL